MSIQIEGRCCIEWKYLRNNFSYTESSIHSEIKFDFPTVLVSWDQEFNTLLICAVYKNYTEIRIHKEQFYRLFRFSLPHVESPFYLPNMFSIDSLINYFIRNKNYAKSSRFNV